MKDNKIVTSFEPNFTYKVQEAGREGKEKWGKWIKQKKVNLTEHGKCPKWWTENKL